MGYWAAKFLTQNGAKLVGVAEYDGSIYNSKGLDPEALINYKKVVLLFNSLLTYYFFEFSFPYIYFLLASETRSNNSNFLSFPASQRQR